MVAVTALTAVLALVAAPGTAGSRTPSGLPAIMSDQMRAVALRDAPPEAATYTPDPAARSATTVEPGTIIAETALAGDGGPSRPAVDQPTPDPGVIVLNPWRWDWNVSFYGPGFYGWHTACGYLLTGSLMGVAHRSLPCGTLVTFHNPQNGRTVTVPVVDRGPYVSGRQWDMTGGLCVYLGHCWTGPLEWKFGS